MSTVPKHDWLAELHLPGFIHHSFLASCPSLQVFFFYFWCQKFSLLCCGIQTLHRNIGMNLYHKSSIIFSFEVSGEEYLQRNCKYSFSIQLVPFQGLPRRIAAFHFNLFSVSSTLRETANTQNTNNTKQDQCGRLLQTWFLSLHMKSGNPWFMTWSTSVHYFHVSNVVFFFLFSSSSWSSPPPTSTSYVSSADSPFPPTRPPLASSILVESKWTHLLSAQTWVLCPQ